MPRFGALVLAGCLFSFGPASAQYKEIPVTGGGSITGRIRVSGEVPMLPPQPVFKEKATCGESVRDERLVVGTQGALRNAVVFLSNVPAGKALPGDAAVQFDNRQCAFVPHVLSATVGQGLAIHNSDPFLHDAHAFLGSRTLFNVAVRKGATVHQPLSEPGLMHMNCNVRHTWMHAYLYVFDHPYHAVTDAAGEFRIDAIPPGAYTLRVWHELLGAVDREVTVGAGKTTTVDVGLAAGRPRRIANRERDNHGGALHDA